MNAINPARPTLSYTVEKNQFIQNEKKKKPLMPVKHTGCSDDIYWSQFDILIHHKIKLIRGCT